MSSSYRPVSSAESTSRANLLKKSMTAQLRVYSANYAGVNGVLSENARSLNGSQARRLPYQEQRYSIFLANVCWVYFIF